LGLTGGLLVVGAVVMALVDLYPTTPATPGGLSWPAWTGPTNESLNGALRVLLITVAGTALGVWLAGKWLPKTPLYASLVSQGASGAATTAAFVAQEHTLLGQTGVTISALCPGGKARFGESILDVMSQGDMLEKGRAVRVIGFSTGTAIVEAV
jgi:membrane-bound serine protease (ClpP class)